MVTMKALSLTQPYASLVMIGAKTIETRSWQTHHRGHVAIHASKTFPRWAYDLSLTPPFSTVLRDQPWFKQPVTGRPPRPERHPDMPRSVVLGIVDVVDCVPTTHIHRSASSIERRRRFDDNEYRIGPNEAAFGDYTFGRWAWILDLVEVFDEPIPATGALGLWAWEDPR